MPHVLAGTRVLENYALRIIPGRANALLSLPEQHRMQIEEHHYINEFLLHLVGALPPQSTWCGVTHLHAGWLSESAEPGYSNVVEQIQERCHRETLAVFRIYCARSLEELQPLKAHLERERANGIVVRIALGESNTWPPDLTLLWTEMAQKRDDTDPVGQLRRMNAPEPTVALQFTTAVGRLIKKLDIFDGNDNNARVLTNLFRGSWERAQPWVE